MNLRMNLTAGLFLLTAAMISAQSPTVPTPPATTPTPATATSPPADGSPDSAGPTRVPSARTPWRSEPGRPPADSKPSAQGPNSTEQAARGSDDSQNSSIVNKTATTPPSTLADCARDGWRTYSGPAYKSQKTCEQWVRKHVKTSAPGAAVPTPAAGSSHPHSETTPPGS